MPRLNANIDVGKITDLPTFIRWASQLFDNIASIINGKIDFDKNIASQTISQTFSSANTDVSISHNLNKTGVNFIVVNKNVSCDIYHGSGADSASQIFLKSTVAGANVTLTLF